ncbi:MAG: hypothetical protein NT179_10680 [Nitrospirae bacterium]|nr:hypothetical protein [Nitrospirota bacterium]
MSPTPEEAVSTILTHLGWTDLSVAVLLVAALQFLSTLWIKARLEASIKYEHDKTLEGFKSAIATRSSFRQKWADEFFGTCQEFMKSFERYLALLNQLTILKDPNSEVGVKYQQELTALNASLSELELRIRRMVVFAELARADVCSTAAKVLTSLTEMVTPDKISGRMQGSFDEQFKNMDAFNKATKNAHAEMLSVQMDFN